MSAVTLSSSRGLPPLQLDEEHGRILVQVDLDRVASFFTCSECTGLFRDPHTISECVHTFCKSCIVKKILQTHECPICKCKTTIGTVRPDHTMQSLLQKLFPEAEKEDEEREKKWYEEHNIPMPEKQLVNNGNGNGYQPKHQPKQQQQQANKQQHDAKRQKTTETSTNQQTSNTCAKVSAAVGRIRLLVKSEDGKHDIAEPHLEVATTTKVERMRSYIAKKLNIAPERIVLMCENLILPLEHSTEFVQRTIWKDPTTNMVWWYKVTSS